jgi:hypothetical protein
MDASELPAEPLDAFKQAYVQSAAQPRVSTDFAGRENDAAVAVQGGLVKNLRGDWATRVDSGGKATAAADAGFVGRENDATTAVQARSSMDAATAIASPSPVKQSFAGRENDTATAVKPGNIKDRLSMWGQKADEAKSSVAGGFAVRENDAATVIAGSLVKGRAIIWGTDQAGEEGAWKGRENDAHTVVPKRE